VLAFSAFLTILTFLGDLVGLFFGYSFDLTKALWGFSWSKVTINWYWNQARWYGIVAGIAIMGISVLISELSDKYKRLLMAGDRAPLSRFITTLLQEKSHGIFVSYSDEEAYWAKEFVQTLTQRGLHVWIDQLAARTGEPIREAVEEGLRERGIFLILIDPSILSFPFPFFQLGAAIGMGKNVVAIVPEDFDPAQLPLPLRARRFLFIKRASGATASELPGTEQGTGSEA
jgi:hypothetical protein